MHPSHPVFLDAIVTRHRLSARFFHRKEQREVVRACAPLDYGPLRGAKDGASVYQLWDLEAKRKPYNVTIAEADLREVTRLDETFDPAAIITWAFKPHAWHVARDWAEFS